MPPEGLRDAVVVSERAECVGSLDWLEVSVSVAVALVVGDAERDGDDDGDNDGEVDAVDD